MAALSGVFVDGEQTVSIGIGIGIGVGVGHVDAIGTPPRREYDARSMGTEGHLTVLGGGPAGLATALFARRAGLGVTLLEASDQVGGTCRTFEHEGFRFDSGAHRLHDKDPGVTALVRELLGEHGLHRVEAPSRIFDDGRFVEFPLTAGGLLRHLGPAEMARCAADMAVERLRARGAAGSFEAHSVRRYGRRLAGRYLLSYSEKLWGTPCSELSPVVAGGRLRGLDLRTFLTESILGRRTNHMEGSFLYPRRGIEAIPAAMAHAVGDGVIRTGSRVVGIRHRDGRVEAVVVDGGEVVETERVASTLPLGVLLRILDPQPPADVVEAATRLRFRNVRLAVVLVDRPSVTDAATLYFPDSRLPFARVAEPRNRCPEMAPAGRTALAAEIPCSDDDRWWRDDDRVVEEVVAGHLARIGLVAETDVLGTTSRRLPHAYPVLDRAALAASDRAGTWLRGLGNLHLAGRGGLFMYGWIHDMVRGGRELVARIGGC